MQYGTIMVYRGKTFFMFENELPGKFLSSIPGSNSTFLTSGKFRTNQFHKDSCEVATPQQQEEYRRLVQSSKYAKELETINLF